MGRLPRHPGATSGAYEPLGAAPYSNPWVSGRYYMAPNYAGTTTSNGLGNSVVRYTPIWVPNSLTLSRIGTEITSAGDAGRSVTDGVLNSTTTLTSATAAFVAGDKGRLLTGTGIPAETYIVSVTNGTTVVMSKAATATASGVSVAISGCRLRLGIFADDGTNRPGTLLVDAGTIDGNSATVQELTIALAVAGGRYYLGAAVQGVTTTQPTVRVQTFAGIVPGVEAGTTMPGTNTVRTGFTENFMDSVFGNAGSGGTLVASNTAFPRTFLKVA